MGHINSKPPSLHPSTPLHPTHLPPSINVKETKTHHSTQMMFVESLMTESVSMRHRLSVSNPTCLNLVIYVLHHTEPVPHPLRLVLDTLEKEKMLLALWELCLLPGCWISYRCVQSDPEVWAVVLHGLNGDLCDDGSFSSWCWNVVYLWEAIFLGRLYFWVWFKPNQNQTKQKWTRKRPEVSVTRRCFTDFIIHDR